MTNSLPVGVIFCALTLAAGVSAAQACSSLEPAQSRLQLFSRASAVFVAHLLRTEEIRAATPLDGRPQQVVEATFRTIEIFKGRPPTAEKVRSPVYGPGNCSMPLLAGSDYLFFLYENDGNFVLQLPGGSQMFWNLQGTEVQKTLAELRDFGKNGRVP